MVGASMKEGFAATMRSWRLLLPLYILNLAAAVIVVTPLQFALQQYWGTSVISSPLRQAFSIPALVEFLLHNGDLVRTLFRIFLTVLFLYEILSVFLDGGILAALRSGEARGLSRKLFEGGAAYFFRFLRLFLISIPFMIVGGIILGLIDAPLSSLMDSSQRPVEIFLVLGARIAVAVLLFSYIRAVMDYAKVAAVSEDRRVMWKAFWRGLGFSVRNFGRAYGMFLILLLIYLATVALHLYVNSSINESTAVLILLLFIIEQLFVLVRIGERVWFFGSELSLFSKLASVVAIRPVAFDPSPAEPLPHTGTPHAPLP